MWREALTIIALESREPSRPSDYLTLEQAQAADGIRIEEVAGDRRRLHRPGAD